MVAALEEHTQAMTALSRQRFVERSLSARDFTAAGLALTAEFHHRTHTVLPEANTATATPALTATARASWPELDLRQHKGIIGSVLQYAVVHPIGQANGARFRPERVTLHWWEERSEETNESSLGPFT